MTTSDNTKLVELPAPQFPLLTRMVSKGLFDDREVAITWEVGKPHPLATNMSVMRMFVTNNAVEVYAMSVDSKIGMRNLVPMSMVRFTEESMPLPVFIEELAAAEAGGDDDEDEDDEDLDEPAPPNGSAGSPITS